MTLLPTDLPASPVERALALQNLLVAACEGPSPGDEAAYRALRLEFMHDPLTAALLPAFVRTCRDLDHFWGYIKQVNAQWAPRRHHVREAFVPLLDRMERGGSPGEATISDALAAFDEASVHAAWKKALKRRADDPEGAITAARTLLETVCKHVLDDGAAPGTGYGEHEDLPKLYHAVAKKLNLAPSQHTEDVFKRLLGGCSSVVEGLGSLRNKVGDAHGQGRRAVRVAPRHAQLAVNLAGAMATFIVETWSARCSDASDHDTAPTPPRLTR